MKNIPGELAFKTDYSEGTPVYFRLYLKESLVKNLVSKTGNNKNADYYMPYCKIYTIRQKRDGTDYQTKINAELVSTESRSIFCGCLK